MQQENMMSRFVAMPRLHKNFQEEDVLILDPMQRENSIDIFPQFPWDKVTAQQCLYDFKQNTLEFAKDKKGALQSFDVYSMQKAKTTLSNEEIAALMEFTGEKNTNSLQNPLEILQQILILAFYKEEQFLELQEISQKVQAQQEKLTILLDREEKGTSSFSLENEEYLPLWKYVFYAILVFTQKNEEYFINDIVMAQELFTLYKDKFELKEIAEKKYYIGVLQQEDFLSFIPESFRELILQTKITVAFTSNFVE